MGSQGNVYRRDLLTDIKTTILDLVKDLKDNIFTELDEQGEFMMVEFFFKRMHPEAIMNHIVEKILPWKEKINKRDQNYFLENTALFEGLPKDRISHYGQVISGGDRVDDEDRKTVWEYFDTMVAIAEGYRKVK